jgi:T5SS/PEP-CTERM-associated repeat protein
MKSHRFLLPIFALLVFAPTVPGAILASGNCSPAASDPKWQSGLGAGRSGVVGNTGPGYLTIDDGSDVVATRIDLGYGSTGRGSLVLDGPGSSLQMTHYDDSGQRYTPLCFIGLSGHGYVEVINGAELLTSGIGGVTGLGHYEGSFGSVVVDGPGSRFTAKSLYIGQAGTGVVTLMNGGTLSTRYLQLKSSVTGQGIMHIHVGGDDLLMVGNSGMENNGTIHLYAGMDLAPGTYTPIQTDGVISGSGHVSGHGGVWDLATRTFTVGPVVDASGGLTGSDLSGGRYAFAGGSLVAAFAGDAGIADFGVTELAVSMLGAERVLGAFDFETTVGGASTLLSYRVGEGHDVGDLTFWHRQEVSGDWVAFTPEQARVVGDRVEFTVSGFSGYAVSTIPEPGVTLLLLLAGLRPLRRVRRH